MENLENNKLIATFLNWDVDSIGRYDTPFFVNIDGEEESFLTLTELCFSYDWNWLMLAVEKIEEIKDISVQIECCFCQIIENNNHINEVVTVDNCNTKIETVYTAVIEFIKWYNLNK